jgi:hypothetical protein
LLRTIATGVGLSLMTIAASAHHSDAAFDPHAAVTLQGVVRQFSWHNPHIRVDLDVTDPDGRIATWSVEGNPPGRIRGPGLKDAVKVGSHVTVNAYRARDASQRYARGVSLTLADGRRFTIGSDR